MSPETPEQIELAKSWTALNLKSISRLFTLHEFWEILSNKDSIDPLEEWSSSHKATKQDLEPCLCVFFPREAISVDIREYVRVFQSIKEWLSLPDDIRLP